MFKVSPRDPEEGNIVFPETSANAGWFFIIFIIYNCTQNDGDGSLRKTINARPGPIREYENLKSKENKTTENQKVKAKYI